MRKIPGFPDYRIDTLGQVWSLKNARTTANGHIVPKRLKPIRSSSGELRYQLINNTGRFTRSAARLALEAYHRPAKKDEVPFHEDGDRENCNTKNLVWKNKKDVPVALFKIRDKLKEKDMPRHLKRALKKEKIKYEKEHVSKDPKESGKGR